MEGIAEIMRVLVTLAALGQAPAVVPPAPANAESPRIMFADRGSGCDYLVQGTVRGLEIAASAPHCAERIIIRSAPR